ncbi:hypothetical protein Patl1_20730 [Pistacia atlantica]|uniref:Uncharacterized protein n=1 Tax=Pistacia atlantica TaxID=434234 RepID=A0ACC1BJT7_9ROSI|nr:hypothetical protein Patl1_20730 [Pistacia atlantica]
MGAIGMVGSKCDFAFGDQISRAEYYYCSVVSLYFHCCTDISSYALSLQVRDFLLLWRMGGGGDDLICVLPETKNMPIE